MSAFGKAILFYFLVMALVVIAAVSLSGCAEKPRRGDVAKDCSVDPSLCADAPGSTSPAKEAPIEAQYDTIDGLPIVTDARTGCQYIGYTSHGLTPRVVSVNGILTHMGCYAKEEVPPR